MTAGHISAKAAIRGKWRHSKPWTNSTLALCADERLAGAHIEVGLRVGTEQLGEIGGVNRVMGPPGSASSDLHIAHNGRNELL
jgi:hypothetical protein